MWLYKDIPPPAAATARPPPLGGYLQVHFCYTLKTPERPILEGAGTVDGHQLLLLRNQPLEAGPVVAELELLVQRRVHLGGHRDDRVVVVASEAGGGHRSVGGAGPRAGMQRFLPPVGRARGAGNGRDLRGRGEKFGKLVKFCVTVLIEQTVRFCF